jgi:hypothetical protein
MRPPSKVDSLLNQGPKGEKKKASFNLTRGTFERFAALCDARGVGQSDLIDALLEDLLDRQGRKAKDVPKKMATKKVAEVAK